MRKLRFRRKRVVTVLIFLLITLAVGFLWTLQFGIEVNRVQLRQPEITAERRNLVETLDHERNTAVMVWRGQEQRSSTRRTSFRFNPTTAFLTQKGSQKYSGGVVHKTTQHFDMVQQLARSELQPDWQEDQVKVFVEWQQNKRTACDGKVEIFPGHFVSLREVVFRKDLVSSKNAGGEEMSSVMEQSEEDEYFTLNKGFFSLACRELPAEYRLSDHKGHLNKWLDNISQFNSSTRANPISSTNDFTIIIKRYEYVNFYHSMTDFYNAFLVMTFFRKSPNGTKILLFDTHPKGSLDVVWRTLFKSAFRVSQLQAVTRFRHAAWSIPGYDSPMFDYTEPESIPLIEEFRQFFLKQYRVREKRDLDCKRGLRLVLVWRRNYVAHPRNPSGKIARKIWNEKQLLSIANKTGYFSSVIGIQLDRLSMKRQLSIISSADILAGMHGAGLTHAVFLPSYAGLIELVPEYFPELGHFEGIAQWRSLHYLRWHNEDVRNEMSEKRTRVPPAVFHRILSKMRRRLCG